MRPELVESLKSQIAKSLGYSNWGAFKKDLDEGGLVIGDFDCEPELFDGFFNRPEISCYDGSGFAEGYLVIVPYEIVSDDHDSIIAVENLHFLRRVDGNDVFANIYLRQDITKPSYVLIQTSGELHEPLCLHIIPEWGGEPLKCEEVLLVENPGIEVEIKGRIKPESDLDNHWMTIHAIVKMTMVDGETVSPNTQYWLLVDKNKKMVLTTIPRPAVNLLNNYFSRSEVPLILGAFMEGEVVFDEHNQGIRIDPPNLHDYLTNTEFRFVY